VYSLVYMALTLQILGLVVGLLEFGKELSIPFKQTNGQHVHAVDVLIIFIDRGCVEGRLLIL
jgi:hypothetical protein